MRVPTLAALLTIAAALVFVAPASAANVVLNPSFEDACGVATKPCYWPDIPCSSGACKGAQRDTSTANSGAASYRLTLGSGFFDISPTSECMDVPLTAGAVTLGFSYRVDIAVGLEVDGVGFVLKPFAGAGCANELDNRSVSRVPDFDGAWHTVSAAVVPLDSAPQSFRLMVFFSCFDCAPQVVNYDDLVVAQEPPTAVAVASARAERTRAGVLLRFGTVSEVGTLGFNVYRQRHGKLMKLNRTLIPSVFGGTPTGHSYSWLDRNVPRASGTLRYRLQAVNLDGTRSWIGSATVK